MPVLSISPLRALVLSLTSSSYACLLSLACVSSCGHNRPLQQTCAFDYLLQTDSSLNQPRPIGIFFPHTQPVPFWAGKRQKDDPLGMWAEELPLKRSAAMRPFYFPSCILPPPQDKKKRCREMSPRPGGGGKNGADFVLRAVALERAQRVPAITIHYTILSLPSTF